MRAVALLICLLGWGAAAMAQAPAPDQLRWEGEFSLSVAERDGALEVRWIVRAPGPGLVRVLDPEGELLQEERTPAGQAHSARLGVPTGPVRLQYGSAREDDRHETWIHPVYEKPPVEVSGVDSLFVVGDVHGEYDRLRELLGNAGVIDGDGRWAAGRAHLVLLGDLLDRGAEVNRLLWFVYGLEKEAERSGGRLHVVLGNHEIMVFTNDDRYVHPKERMLAEAHGIPYPRLYDIRESVLGRWLVSKPAMLRVDDTLLVHGGVTTDFLPYSVTTFNDTLRSFMAEDLFYHWDDETFPVAVDSAALERRNDFFWSDRSVFWDRGYVQSDTLGAELNRVLDGFGSRRMVVAHTPLPSIAARYGGSLIAIHPRLPALEMLLLVRVGSDRQAFRIGTTGPPEVFEP